LLIGKDGFVNSEVYGDSKLEGFVESYPEHGFQINDVSTDTVKTGEGSYRLTITTREAYTLRLRHGAISDPEEVAKSIGRVWETLFYLYEPSEMSQDELKSAQTVADLVTSLAPHQGLWSSYKPDLRRLYLLSPDELSIEMERLAEMGDVIQDKVRQSLENLKNP